MTSRVKTAERRIASFARKLGSGGLLVGLALLSALCFAPDRAALGKEVEMSAVDNLSAELGFPIYSWSKAAKPQAVVLAIHGATLHGRSYSIIAEKLSQKGYAVFSPDLRGFGAWYHNSGPDDLLAKHVLYHQSELDLLKLSKRLHELYPGTPLFIMGESVGANMSIRLLAQNPDAADGMILSSPAIKQRLFFGPTIIKQALTVFFVNPKAQLDITPFLKTRVSEDEKITDERINDPLGRNRLNVGELFKTRFYNKECMRFIPQLPQKLSVLVLEGSEDKLFDAADINTLMTQLPCQDKHLQMLQGKGHIHLETKFLRPEVETAVESWLAEKSSKYAQNNKDETKTTSVSSRETTAAP
ncbi:MAG: lysophospholipase [Candidatus Obscuribacterales bacterium]|nr:lysophospholipase [Candidatus Obscuribacterales bacterium]